MAIYAFAEFELDTQRYELRRSGQPCQVEPQVFDVLVYLAAHRDRVVSKQELLDAVWGDRFVSEATLSSRVMAARKAIDDDGQTQRFIRTIRGRGFRFVGSVVESTRAESEASDAGREPISADSADRALRLQPESTGESGQDLRSLIGREAEIEQLERWLRGALSGARHVVFVTGEAGIGKTTLVDAFLSGTQTDGPR